jgi:hypothetical protein
MKPELLYSRRVKMMCVEDYLPLNHLYFLPSWLGLAAVKVGILYL